MNADVPRGMVNVRALFVVPAAALPFAAIFEVAPLGPSVTPEMRLSAFGP